MPEDFKPSDYDLGDTDLYPKEEVKPYVKETTGEPAAPTTAADPEAAATADSRPRRADGTFLPKPTHPDYLVRQAREFGLSDEDINDMPGNALGLFVNSTLRAQASFRSQQTDARTLQETHVRHDPARHPAAETETSPDDLGLNEAEYDPALLGVIKRQQKENRELKEALSGIVRREQDREISRASQVLDDIFESMGKDYERFFGPGPMHELRDDGQKKRRIAVLNEAGVNIQNASAKALKKVKEAADLLYRPQAQEAPLESYAAAGKPAPPNGRISTQEWNDAAVARPTHRKGAHEPKGDELARANVARKLDAIADAEESEVAEGLL